VEWEKKCGALLSPWRYGPTWAMASSIFRFLDHTQRRTADCKTLLDERSARRRDLCLNRNKTDIHASGGIRTHNPSKRATADTHTHTHTHKITRNCVYWGSSRKNDISCKPVAALQWARVKVCSLPTCDVGLSYFHEYIQTVGKKRRQRSGRHDNDGFTT